MKHIPQWLMEAFDKDENSIPEELITALERSLATAEAYHSDSSSFVKAYTYVNEHPAFWFIKKDKKTDAEWWVTDDYCVLMYKLTLDDKNHPQGYQWALEGGSHVEDDYRIHYHDPELDLYAPTIEEAYIKFAEKVSELYDDYGDEIPNPDKE